MENHKLPGRCKVRCKLILLEIHYDQYLRQPHHGDTFGVMQVLMFYENYMADQSEMRQETV